MIKQKYIVPRVEIVEIVAPQLMLVASGETGGVGSGGGSVGDDTEDLSTTRRGTWGNLWD